MGKQADFRSIRKLLPPESFACAEGPDLPPQDLIDEDVWNSIMNLPDDVCLRTSADHGTELKFMHGLWVSIIETVGNVEDVMQHSLLDVADEIMACIVNSLMGFYTVAASCLRSSLELAAHGAYYQRCKNYSDYKTWRESQGDVNFGEACDRLNGLNDVRDVNNFLYSKMKDTLLEQKNSRYRSYPGGWARKLHSQLSNFVHSRPSYSHVDLWKGSNGPIYVTQSFGRISAMYCDTLALIYVLVKIARSGFSLPPEAGFVFRFPNVKPSKVAIYTYQYLWTDHKI
jgi:hypothetical protein